MTEPTEPESRRFLDALEWFCATPPVVLLYFIAAFTASLWDPNLRRK